jgi:streptogramin lyase
MKALPWIHRAHRSLEAKIRSHVDSKAPSRSRRFQVESLESRWLLSLTVTEFPIPRAPGDISTPGHITTGPDGNLWFTEPFANKIASFNPITHAIAQFPLPLSSGFTTTDHPEGITTGPDGNLWFAMEDAGRIGEFNPTTHAFSVFPLTTDGGAVSITTGPDGNLWFGEIDRGAIGVINPFTHAISEFPNPKSPGSPLSVDFVTSGPDGNIWFTDFQANAIGSINPTTHAITEFPTPTPKSGPEGITVGPDGNLWFAEFNTNMIGSINPTTHVFTESPIPGSSVVNPYEIIRGPDGNLWFTGLFGRDRLGSINPTTHAITVFLLPSNVFPVSAIAFDSVGNLWLGNAVNEAIDEVHFPDGPTVLSVQRFGVHWHPTTLVLSFDQALDPASAQNTAAYQIVAPNGKTIAVNSAVYNASTGTVTLSPAQRLNLHHPYRLVVKGTGPNAVTNTDGQPLDGAHTGKPGSDYSTEVTVANWVRPLHSLRRASLHRR